FGQNVCAPSQHNEKTSTRTTFGKTLVQFTPDSPSHHLTGDGKAGYGSPIERKTNAKAVYRQRFWWSTRQSAGKI
ncbi:hypothetical protein, partial [Rhodococcus erythropolis]